MRMLFCPPAEGEPEDQDEVLDHHITLASRVPLLTRGEIVTQYEGGVNMLFEQHTKQIIQTFPALTDWVTKCRAELKKLVIVNEGIEWMDRYERNGDQVQDY